MIYLIILIPVIVSLVAKYAFKADINWKEFLIQFVGGVAALSLIWVLGRYSAAHDTEVWNGYVTGKHMNHFTCHTNTMNPCQNGYTCHSHQVCSGSGKNRSCHEEHDTCYVYPWEQDWYVDSTLDSFEIERVDRQGANQPPRYSVAAINDPVSTTHSYNNWVKAAADSIYAQDVNAETQYAKIMPTYQQNVYDYYKLDRVYPSNTGLRLNAWNTAVARLNSVYGAKKQINVVIVFVADANRDFANALRRKWEGFKKNEAVLVIGTRGGVITWAQSMSWSKQSIYDVDMRRMVENDFLGKAVSTIDPVDFTVHMSPIIDTDYVRRPMKEFEYLKGDIPPPNWLIWVAVIFTLIYGVGTSILFNRYEL